MPSDEQRPAEPPTGVGAGYPEDAPPDTGMDPREHAENEAAPDAEGAPSTSRGEDEPPSHATGNPRAAGG